MSQEHQRQPPEFLLTLRCLGSNCKKILGKVDQNRILHTESMRSGNWIKTEMVKGWVICKFCGNRVSFDRGDVKLVRNGEM